MRSKLFTSLLCVVSFSFSADLPKHWHESGGYSTEMEAGLGGKVIKVTNLNLKDEGSLKYALDQSGPRLIVFEVGGVFEGPYQINNGDVTIAGETAPFPGVTIIKGTLKIRETAHNVVLSHIAVRVGDAVGVADGIEITSEKNVVLNHVISTWGVDETLTLKGVDNITLFKCIVAEALSDSKHPEGEHSKGNLIFRICDPVSVIGCLYAHNRMRNPRISDSRVVMVNSVIYDPAPGHDDSEELWNYFVHLGDNGENSEIPEVSFVGNVGLHGPHTDVKAQYLIAGHKNEKGKAYMKDNIILDTAGKPLTIANENIIPLDQPPLWPNGLKTIPAHESLYECLRTAGPQPGKRDDVTKRIVKTVADGKGGIINSQNDVGGYPKYAETKRSITVPDGVKARRVWLDSLEDEFAVDKDIDLSRLYSRVGSKVSDILKPGTTPVVGSKMGSSGKRDLQVCCNRAALHADLTLADADAVGITVFDLAGNAVAHQPLKQLQAGSHKFAVDVRHLFTGVYICRVKIGKTVLSRRINLGL